MKNMRSIIAVIIAAAAFAATVPAQTPKPPTPKHANMDLKAAKRDIARLQADRAIAKRHHDWKKVAQDDRLIAKDKEWIRKDAQRLEHNRHGK
jgi:hypothetical protein